MIRALTSLALSGDNLRVNKTGSRVCRTCERLHKRPLSGVAS